MSKIIGIVGSRRRNSYEDYATVEQAFFKIYEIGDSICSGGCYKGADRFAEEIATRYHIPIIIFPAEWKKHGKIAGFLRNTDIANKANILIACVAKDRTGGTEDTIKKFKKFHPNNILILI